MNDYLKGWDRGFISGIEAAINRSKVLTSEQLYEELTKTLTILKEKAKVKYEHSTYKRGHN